MAISGCYTDCLCRLSGACVLTNCMSSQRMWSRQPAAHSLLAPPSVEDWAPLFVENQKNALAHRVQITGVFRAGAARENPCRTKRQRTSPLPLGKTLGQTGLTLSRIRV